MIKRSVTLNIKKKRFTIGFSLLVLVLSISLSYYWFRKTNTTEIKGFGQNIRVWNTTIAFDTKFADQKHICQMKPSTVTFHFKNTGNNPLIIYDVNALCGCLKVMEWTGFPIVPGAGGTLKIKIDTDKTGLIDKEVLVYSNSIPNPFHLRIKATICDRNN